MGPERGMSNKTLQQVFLIKARRNEYRVQTQGVRGEEQTMSWYIPLLFISVLQAADNNDPPSAGSHTHTHKSKLARTLFALHPSVLWPSELFHWKQICLLISLASAFFFYFISFVLLDAGASAGYAGCGSKLARTAKSEAATVYGNNTNRRKERRTKYD